MNAKKKIENLYIHIGTDKTGSTSIQEFCHWCRDDLKSHSILYPPGNWHPEFGSYFSSEPDKFIFNKERNIDNAKIIYDRDLNYINEFSIWLDTQEPSEALILSYEGFFGLDKDVFVRFKQFTDNIAENTKIILYIRKPLSYAISALSQRIKIGLDTERMPVYLYEKKLKELVKIFDKKNIIVRLFSKEYLHNSDVVDDFFNILGCHKDYASIVNNKNLKQINANNSLSAEGLIFGKYFIQNLEKYGLKNYYSNAEFHTKFGQYFSKIKGNKIVLNQEQVDFIKNHTRSDSKFVKREFGIDLDESENNYIQKYKENALAKEYFDLLLGMFIDKMVEIKDMRGNISIKGSLPQKIKSNQSIKIKAVINNQSSQDWLSTPENPIRLSFKWLNQKGEAVSELRMDLPVEILHRDHQYPVDLSVQTPNAVGEYVLELTLLIEGNKWFDRKEFNFFKHTFDVS